VRYLSIVILVLASLFAETGRLKAAATEGAKNTRPLDPVAAAILQRALARSPSVQELVRRLELSNVIVHIEASWYLFSGVSGTTQFVATRGGYRFVRITIAAGMAHNSRTAILGHELQHALEIADSTAVTAGEVRKLFEAEGYRVIGGHDFFETAAAIQVEKVVRLELRAGTLRQEVPPRQAVTSRREVPSRQALRSRERR